MDNRGITTTNTPPATATGAITVLGTGTMGAAVARRLLGAGRSVNVWDRSRQSEVALAELGATAYDDPRDAVAAADVVLTWLPTGAAVADVMLGRGVLGAMAPRAVWAQMGTIGVESTARFEAETRAQRADVVFVDAPVSGSRGPAESGQLLVLASGPDGAKAILGPVFDVLGRKTLWLGAAGMGSKVKLVLNTWLAFEVEAAAEGASLAARLGIPSSALAQALDGNPLASPLATAKLAKIQAADDHADFSLEWALKDLDLMQASVESHQAPIAVAIAERWRVLVGDGLGHYDVSAAHFGLDHEAPAALDRAPVASGVAT